MPYAQILLLCIMIFNVLMSLKNRDDQVTKSVQKRDLLLSIPSLVVTPILLFLGGFFVSMGFWAWVWVIMSLLTYLFFTIGAVTLWNNPDYVANDVEATEQIRKDLKFKNAFGHFLVALLILGLAGFWHPLLILLHL